MDFRKATFLGLSTLWLLGSAQAQQPTPDQANAIRQSCRSDFMTNCSGVQPGGADAMACLQRNVPKLSAACKTAVSAITPPTQAPAAPATAPTAAPPTAAAKPPTAPAANVNPTPPSSPPPAPAAAQAQQPTPDQANAIRQSCRSDFMANCSGVQPGGADAMACLQRNLGKLSAACKTAVSAITPPAQAPAAAKPAVAPAAKVNPAPSAPAAAPASPPPAAAAAPSVPPLNPRLFVMPERRLAVLAICHAEADKLCSLSIPEQVIKCLAGQPASLSPTCYDAIARISR